MAIFSLMCHCMQHNFIFKEEPNKLVQVKCPECGGVNTYDPKAVTEKEKSIIEDNFFLNSLEESDK